MTPNTYSIIQNYPKLSNLLKSLPSTYNSNLQQKFFLTLTLLTHQIIQNILQISPQTLISYTYLSQISQTRNP